MKTTLLKNILSFCVLVFSVGALSAQTTWTGATNSDFNEDTNWDTGLSPTGADDVVIAPAAINPILSTKTDGLASDGTQVGFINHLNVLPEGHLTLTDTLSIWSGGGNYLGGNTTIETGGFTNFRNTNYIGTTDNPSTIIINGGTYNSKGWTMIGQNGHCDFIVNDGIMTTEKGSTSSGRNKPIVVGGYYAYGALTINGGIVDPANGIEIDQNGSRSGAGHITIDGDGEIWLSGESLNQDVLPFIADGKLKAGPGKMIEITSNSTGPLDPATVRYIKAVPLSSPKEVAYLTKSLTMAAGASAVDDDAIIRMLQADANFNVTVIIDPDGSTDLSGYDLVIAQETFGSGDAIWSDLLDVQNITKPTIINKAYAWQANKNHISSAASAVTKSTSLSIDVPDSVRQADPLFSGIDLTSGSIQIFNDLSSDDIGTAGGGSNGIHVLNSLEIVQGANAIGGESGTLHATVIADAIPFDAATPTIYPMVFNELRKGTQIGTDAADILQAPVIAFGMSYGAIALGDGANLTSEALTLWRNAAYHLTGMMSPNTLYVNPSLGVDKYGSVSNVTTDVKAVGNRIYVSNVKSTSEVNIYSITGALVKSFKTNQDTNFSFKTGLWIATVKTFEGTKSVKLLTK